tara:strand:+ start:862 stop:1581 length:720 start_codon:yes stop_codon:yes gene_type:complete
MLTKNQIKFIKGLSSKKNRIEHQCFIVEGEKSVLELLMSDFEIIDLYAVDSFIKESDFAEITLITNNELAQISSLKSPNKVLAVVKIPQAIEANRKGVIIVLDSVNDPGNLGTIIRLCDWFGVQQIICSEDTVDMFNPKVVQASMGSLFRTNIFYTSLKNYLKEVETPIFGTFTDGSNIKDLDKLPEDVHLIFGNESNGISEEVTSLVTNRVAVKNIGLKTESLNVAMATAIFLHEFCA